MRSVVAAAPATLPAGDPPQTRVDGAKVAVATTATAPASPGTNRMLLYAVRTPFSVHPTCTTAVSVAVSSDSNSAET